MHKINLAGKKVIVTAGGTRENIDSVRFIGNYSSGKMGEALADAAFTFGAEVTLISTVKAEKPYNTVFVNTAKEMQAALETEFDWLIMAAAVSDFRVENPSATKIKKENIEKEWTLTLVKNPDILSELSKNKSKNQVIVGFCAETDNLIENAKQKIQKKGCDFIVANDVSRSDIGFSKDENEVYILDKELSIEKIEKAPKIEIARKILEYVYDKSF